MRGCVTLEAPSAPHTRTMPVESFDLRLHKSPAVMVHRHKAVGYSDAAASRRPPLRVKQTSCSTVRERPGRRPDRAGSSLPADGRRGSTSAVPPEVLAGGDVCISSSTATFRLGSVLWVMEEEPLPQVRPAGPAPRATRAAAALLIAQVWLLVLLIRPEATGADFCCD